MNKMLQSLKLSLLHVGCAKLDSSWDYDNVISPFSRIYLCTEGSAKIFHSYEEIDLKPGYLYLVPSFTYSRYQVKEYHEHYYVHFLEEIADGLTVYDLKHFCYELKANDTDLLTFKRLVTMHPNRKLKNDNPAVYDNRSAVSLIAQKNDSLPANSFVETHALIQLLFSRFIRNGKGVRIHLRSNFHEVLNYIKEHLHQKLSITDLAKHYNLSPDHFSRVFHQKFGLRPSTYIQTVRIERSETLLLTTKKSIAEIAEKTGWDSVSYYNRVFKKTTGKTPGEFRKQKSLH